MKRPVSSLKRGDEPHPAVSRVEAKGRRFFDFPQVGGVAGWEMNCSDTMRAIRDTPHSVLQDMGLEEGTCKCKGKLSGVLANCQIGWLRRQRRLPVAEMFAIN